MRSKIVVVGLFILSGYALGAGITIPVTTIDCTLDTVNVHSFMNGKWVEDKSENKPMTVTFTDLNGKKPKLVGNLGSEELVRIDGDSVVYLIESTGGGNLNLWTWFPEQNAMIMKKQYFLVSAPFSINFYGSCKARK